jgi:hypothetical protein
MMMNDDYLKADGFDSAVIGTADIWRDGGKVSVLVYNANAVVEILEKDGMSYEEACEYVTYNVEGAYVGEKTPVFVWAATLDDLQ